MKNFIGLLLFGAVIGGFWMHRHQEVAATSIIPAPTVSTALPQPTRAPSEHDWAKSALDRAADVKKQVLAQRKEDGAN